KRELPQAMVPLRGVVTQPTTALYVGELAWASIYYVTDEDIKAPLKEGGVEADLKELTFYEQKVNGKSRGVVFLEFSSTEAAVRAKELLENA
ncbi:hypothetical protein BX666DRAFT_1849602, partial [Dichotomocladium elegans]